MNFIDMPDFDGMALDTRTIPQERLNIDNKERSNLFPWKGQFSPQLVEVLLQTYAKAGSFVLDPFLGSGTVLHEAVRLNHPAFGSEVNPAAYKMAEVYRFANLRHAKRMKSLEEAADLIEAALPAAASLFSLGKQIPNAPLQQTISEEFARAENPLCKTLLDALVVLLNYGHKELTPDGVVSAWKKLRDTVLAFPFSEAPVELANCDARALPLRDRRADVVITSPPYINVFNYHQQYRRSVESLGWDLLEVAKSEIGSNRKHRGNRFLTVIQYCLDMADVFRELRRVCQPGGQIIFVMGRESNVRKTRFFNGEIIAMLAVRSAGYQFQSRQERVFRNRFGELIYEDILHLSLRPLDHAIITPPREIAKEVLTTARRRAPAESMIDLNNALEMISEVEPSPMYRHGDTLSSMSTLKRREVV